MTKASSGVYQLHNGMWGFRYAFWVDGKQKDIKRTKDENGNPFKTERAAAVSSILDLEFYVMKHYTVTENQFRISTMALLYTLSTVIFSVAKGGIIRYLKGTI